MFIQVITGKVVDREGYERQLDRWEQELRPGAEGFLGSTSGITEDGRMIALARFESEDAARRNSERPEQGEWWAETEKTLSDVKFQDSVEVMTMRGGGSDDAGFVQVMRGRITDKEKAEAMKSRMGEFEAAITKHRPDVLGDVNAIHADGSYTDAIYFTNEAEARENEAKEMSPEMQSMFEEFMAVFAVDEFLDLKEPRFT